MLLSEAHETENSTVSAGSNRSGKCRVSCFLITVDQNTAGGSLKSPERGPPGRPQSSASSRRRPISAYSTSRSLTDRPRRSAWAASCSAGTTHRPRSLPAPCRRLHAGRNSTAGEPPQAALIAPVGVRPPPAARRPPPRRNPGRPVFVMQASMCGLVSGRPPLGSGNIPWEC